MIRWSLGDFSHFCEVCAGFPSLTYDRVANDTELEKQYVFLVNTAKFRFQAPVGLFLWLSSHCMATEHSHNILVLLHLLFSASLRAASQAPSMSLLLCSCSLFLVNNCLHGHVSLLSFFFEYFSTGAPQISMVKIKQAGNSIRETFSQFHQFPEKGTI